MFQFLRNLIGPIMILVLVAFIATIIFSWGGGGFRNRPDDTIGVIDGENIPFRQFDRYYTQVLNQERNKTDEDLTPQQMENLRNQAWRQLQADFLLNREIKDYNIYVSEQELYDFLKLYPPQELQNASQFMTDGKFDYQKYINAMVNPDNAPFWASVEQYVLPDLKKYKLQEEIISTVRVTPAEVMDNFMKAKESAKLAFVNMSYSAFTQPDKLPKVTEEEARAYYDEHKEDYKRDERAVLDVVTIPKEPSGEDWAQLKSRIDELYDSLQAGSDFAELARTYSEDNSASRGGDLGYFTQGRMVPAFDSAVFAMKKGEISKPVKTRFGYHLIKLLDIRKNDKGQEERNAAHILLKAEPSSDTFEQLSKNANNFATEARNTGFEEAAKADNYEIQTTEPFTKNGSIRMFGMNAKINEFAFNNDIGAISDPFEDSRGFHIVSVKEHLAADYVPFDEAKAAIERTVAYDKAKKIARDSMAVVYGAIEKGTSFRQAANKYGLKYDTTGTITPTSMIRGIGNSPDVIGAAFALAKKDQVSEPVDYNNGVVVLKLLEKTAPSIEEFNQVQDSVYQATLLAKRQAMYNRWYNNLVEDANVQTFIDRFYQSY